MNVQHARSESLRVTEGDTQDVFKQQNPTHSLTAASAVLKCDMQASHLGAEIFSQMLG